VKTGISSRKKAI